jgi:uncharacterized protein (UPF0335 family)
MHGELLRQYIERIQKLTEEKQSIALDIREVFGEVKANGYDTKIIRQIIKLLAMDAADREEQEALLDLYKGALGMIPPTEDEDI